MCIDLNIPGVEVEQQEKREMMLVSVGLALLLSSWFGVNEVDFTCVDGSFFKKKFVKKKKEDWTVLLDPSPPLLFFCALPGMHLSDIFLENFFCG